MTNGHRQPVHLIATRNGVAVRRRWRLRGSAALSCIVTIGTIIFAWSLA